MKLADEHGLHLQCFLAGQTKWLGKSIAENPVKTTFLKPYCTCKSAFVHAKVQRGSIQVVWIMKDFDERFQAWQR
jgi:hypothetical protein